MDSAVRANTWEQSYPETCGDNVEPESLTEMPASSDKEACCKHRAAAPNMPGLIYSMVDKRSKRGHENQSPSPRRRGMV